MRQQCNSLALKIQHLGGDRTFHDYTSTSKASRIINIRFWLFAPLLSFVVHFINLVGCSSAPATGVFVSQYLLYRELHATAR